MIQWIRNIFRRITGISTPLGGLSWSTSESKLGKVATLSDPIYITYPENQGIISFLERNDRKVVFLDTHIDTSVSIEEQWAVVEKEGLNLDLITSCAFSGVPLPIPNKENRLVTLTFHFNDDHVLQYSAGGTGIITVSINGFFEVYRTFHGGPTTAFHLKEIKASLEAKIDTLNR